MYKKRTKNYGIPYVSKGEIIESAEEEKAAKIIDNLLYASTFGVAKCVYEDGNYRVNLNGDGLYTLSVIPYNGYSFLGIVNYYLFSSKEIKKIEGLRSGNIYYIYVIYQEGLCTDSERFLLIAETNKLVDSVLTMHVATIDLTGISPVIDEEPYDKKYTTNIIGHINDKSNPHGRVLHQDELQVMEKLYVEGTRIHSYEFQELDLQSGKSVYEINFSKNVVFVSYMNLSKPQNIWFETSNEKLMVHSEGKIGKIKIKAELE